MKKNKKVAFASRLSQENAERKYFVEASRKLPIYKCWINSDWETVSMSVACIARKRPNGNFVVGAYMVDPYCLGVKNAYSYLVINEETLEHHINTEIFEAFDHNFIEADPTLVQNFVWGAVEFGEDNGFDPHVDFEVAQYILDPADEIEFIDIEFGKNGQPLYIAGPYDNQDRIVATLIKKLGMGNFKYVLRLGGFDDKFEDYEEEDDEDDDDNFDRFELLNDKPDKEDSKD
jgi:hypothetical protein